MSHITKDQVKHLAKLTRLKLSEAQEEALLGDMENIMTMIDKLNEIEVGEAETDACHCSEAMKPRSGTVAYDDPDALLQNIKHPLKNRGITISTSLKEKK